MTPRTPDQMNRVIAEACDEAWCWHRCEACCGTGISFGRPRDDATCRECSGEGRLALDFADPNGPKLVRLLEWAQEQEWWPLVEDKCVLWVAEAMRRHPPSTWSKTLAAIRDIIYDAIVASREKKDGG